MSPPSSISSSELRRYLLVLGGVLGALLAALAAITATGYGLGIVDSDNAEIYAYQLDKIEHMGKADIVFVGDSSLGNVIDAGLFTRLSGLPTVNLALTGSYGSGGALNMMRRVLQQGGHPRVIVIMQSITTMTKDRALAGYYFSAPTLSRLTLPPDKILEIYLNGGAARQILRQLGKKGLHLAPTMIRNDFVEQRSRSGDTVMEKLKPLQPDMVADSQLEYLVRIASLCRDSGLVCVYAHGPIIENYCREGRGYIESLDTRIRKAGLQVVSGTPLCLRQGETGDSLDHVKPALKQLYTRRYFQLFSEKLALLTPRDPLSLAVKTRAD